MPVLAKQPSITPKLAAITVLRRGSFVNLYICRLRESFIYRFFFLFEILYLKWKENNYLAGLKMPRTIKWCIFFFGGGGMWQI